MLTYPDEYMSRCFEENLMHNSTASRINLLPNKPFKYKRVWTIQYFCSWVYFNAFQVFVWNMHLMAIEWKLMSMFFFWLVELFISQKIISWVQKYFPFSLVLVSISSRYIQNREIVFFWNWPIIPRCVNVARQVLPCLPYVTRTLLQV